MTFLQYFNHSVYQHGIQYDACEFLITFLNALYWVNSIVYLALDMKFRNQQNFKYRF